MKIKKTKIKDLLVIKLDKFNDSRGSLTKVLNKKYSKKFNNNCYESYSYTLEMPVPRPDNFIGEENK